MRFGLFGGPIRLSGSGSDLDVYTRYLDEVIEAEALGYYGAYMVEHHFTGSGQVSSSLTVLSHLAARTQKLRLGTAVVVVPWHNPLLLAEQAATIDLLSGGRLDLGLGRGYRDYEFRGFGIDPAEASSLYEETVEVLLKAWGSQQRFSHHGEHWDFEDVVIEPSPIQKPHPPIWTGAGSIPSIEAAATRGFRLFLDQVGSTELTAKRVAAYRATREAAGQPYDASMIALTRALRICRSEAERDAQLETQVQVLKFLAEGAKSSKGTSHPFYSDPETRRQTAEESAMLGTPEECIKRVRELQAVGVEQVLFAASSIDDLRLFAQEVMPAFA